MEEMFFIAIEALQLKEKRKNNNANSFYDVAIMILIENVIENWNEFTEKGLAQFNFCFRSKVSRLS